jgi:hypothetical protein
MLVGRIDEGLWAVSRAKKKKKKICQEVLVLFGVLSARLCVLVSVLWVRMEWLKDRIVAKDWGTALTE